MTQGRKNIYQCSACEKFIVTLDLDDGTTPMFLSCRATKECTGMMQSQGYPHTKLPHQFEFFKPKDITKYHGEYREHLAMGGLDLRRRVDTMDDSANQIVLHIRNRYEEISIGNIQLHSKLGYLTASKIMDNLVFYGVVFPWKDKNGKFTVVQEVPWEGEGIGGVWREFAT